MQKLFKLCIAFCLLMVTAAAPLHAAGPSSMVTIGEGDDFFGRDVDLKIGDAAPEFSLPNLSTDKMENLRDYFGKPIVLFFIQSACYSCLQEAKALQEVKRNLGDKVVVLAVGVDLIGKPMLVSWAAHNNINYPVLLDPIFSVPEKYGFSYTPSSVIIDKNGKIAFIHAGFRPDDIKYFEEKLLELLDK